MAPRYNAVRVPHYGTPSKDTGHRVIQVIDRLFQILNVLSRTEKAGVAAIAAEVGLAKSTASNILKTLVDLGYLGKNELSEYYFAKPFFELVEANMQRDVLMRLAEEYSGSLSARTHETVVIAALRDYLYYVIAEATYDQTVTVNANVYQSRPVYRSVTGRVLLAFSDPEIAAEVRRRVSLAGGDWPGVSDDAALCTAVRRIRTAGCAELTREQVYAIARPVFGPGRTVACAIGLYMPVSRLSPDKKLDVQHALGEAADQMSAELIGKLQTLGGCHEYE